MDWQFLLWSENFSTEKKPVMVNKLRPFKETNRQTNFKKIHVNLTHSFDLQFQNENLRKSGCKLLEESFFLPVWCHPLLHYTSSWREQTEDEAWFAWYLRSEIYTVSYGYNVCVNSDEINSKTYVVLIFCCINHEIHYLKKIQKKGFFKSIKIVKAHLLLLVWQKLISEVWKTNNGIKLVVYQH